MDLQKRMGETMEEILKKQKTVNFQACQLISSKMIFQQYRISFFIIYNPF